MNRESGERRAPTEGRRALGERRGAGMSANRTEKEQVRVHIRWMIRRDMPEVLQIEQESFDYSWTEEDFLRCLRQRNCIGMVAEQGEKVVGFMIYELHKNKLHISELRRESDVPSHGGGRPDDGEADQQAIESSTNADHAGGARAESGERNCSSGRRISERCACCVVSTTTAARMPF